MAHFPKSKIVDALCRRNKTSSNSSTPKNIQSRSQVKVWDKVKYVLNKVCEALNPLKEIVSTVISLCYAGLCIKKIFLRKDAI